MNKNRQHINSTEPICEALDSQNSHGTFRIIELLREQKLNSENVLAESLLLKDDSGMSVPDVCIERLKEPVSDNDGQIVPRALFLVNKSCCGLPLYFRKTCS